MHTSTWTHWIYPDNLEKHPPTDRHPMHTFACTHGEQYQYWEYGEHPPSWRQLMFTHMQTYGIYSGNRENHPQWTGHFMIHTEYFTFNILTLQEHTLCIECKLARHSSRIVKYAIMLFATFRSLNTLRGIIAYRPHITGRASVSTLSFPILSFRLWWLTYSAGFSTCAKMTPKMPQN